MGRPNMWDALIPVELCFRNIYYLGRLTEEGFLIQDSDNKHSVEFPVQNYHFRLSQKNWNMVLMQLSMVSAIYLFR